MTPKVLLKVIHSFHSSSHPSNSLCTLTYKAQPSFPQSTHLQLLLIFHPSTHSSIQIYLQPRSHIKHHTYTSTSSYSILYTIFTHLCDRALNRTSTTPDIRSLIYTKLEGLVSKNRKPILPKPWVSPTSAQATVPRERQPLLQMISPLRSTRSSTASGSTSSPAPNLTDTARIDDDPGRRNSSPTTTTSTCRLRCGRTSTLPTTRNGWRGQKTPSLRRWRPALSSRDLMLASAKCESRSK